MGYSGTDGVEGVKRNRARREKRQKTRDARKSKDDKFLHLSDKADKSRPLSEDERLVIQQDIRESKKKRLKRNLLGTFYALLLLIGFVLFLLRNSNVRLF